MRAWTIWLTLWGCCLPCKAGFATCLQQALFLSLWAFNCHSVLGSPLYWASWKDTTGISICKRTWWRHLNAVNVVRPTNLYSFGANLKDFHDTRNEAPDSSKVYRRCLPSRPLRSTMSASARVWDTPSGRGNQETAQSQGRILRQLTSQHTAATPGPGSPNNLSSCGLEAGDWSSRLWKHVW